MADLRKARRRESTACLPNGGTLEHAQQTAGHASPKTTKLYDRTAETAPPARLPGLQPALLTPTDSVPSSPTSRACDSPCPPGKPHAAPPTGPAPSACSLKQPQLRVDYRVLRSLCNRQAVPRSQFKPPTPRLAAHPPIIPPVPSEKPRLAPAQHCGDRRVQSTRRVP